MRKVMRLVLLVLMLALAVVPALAQAQADVPADDVFDVSVLTPIATLILGLVAVVVAYRSLSPDNAQRLTESTDNALVRELVGDAYRHGRELIVSVSNSLVKATTDNLKAWKPELTPSQIDDIAKASISAFVEQLKAVQPPQPGQEFPYPPGTPPGNGVDDDATWEEESPFNPNLGRPPGL